MCLKVSKEIIQLVQQKNGAVAGLQCGLIVSIIVSICHYKPSLLPLEQWSILLESRLLTSLKPRTG